jgi:hypothetical protein
MRGLNLALELTNSYDHMLNFIESQGMQKLYEFIQTDNNKDNYLLSFSKIKALEVLNSILTF